MNNRKEYKDRINRIYKTFIMSYNTTTKVMTVGKINYWDYLISNVTEEEGIILAKEYIDNGEKHKLL